MIRSALAAALFATFTLCTPVSAQSTSQEALDERYDRALAAGYKALFLCSAIANAERNGATRTPESVMEWELAGIQAPLDRLIGDLPFRIERFGEEPEFIAGKLLYVAVDWAEDMPPRMAAHHYPGGCSLRPIGSDLTGIPFEEAAPNDAASNVDWNSDDPRRAIPIAPEPAVYGENTRTTAVAIVKDGKLIGEHYAPGFGVAVPQRTWSVAKSIAATLVGAAVQGGEVDVTDLARLAPKEVDPRHAITIDHLLRMASGRYSDTPGNRTDPLYFGGATVEETAAHWPLLHQPGTVYRYANNDTLMAVKAIDDSFDSHPPAQFFARLGMAHTVAETDWQGDYVLSSQVWSTARDLALFGQLYLDDGVLPDGTRVFSEGWVDYVSAPSGPQPDGPFGYGAGFWLMNKSEGIPPDTIAAMGNRGQYVVIVPSRNVVIVRRGEDPVGARFDIAAFTRDTLEKLRN